MNSSSALLCARGSLAKQNSVCFACTGQAPPSVLRRLPCIMFLEYRRCTNICSLVPRHSQLSNVSDYVLGQDHLSIVAVDGRNNS
jgi:hypothetical protein